ncbi:hypothetical protein [Poseidonocella sp. HB161398]|uniref:hypothetical protein n=1 Tax=Poseidonocella sp. HB161398 TaxID=2320855 RepID=UPI001108AA0B|nr:hypothetical protein [Poseidonocella sp. HB161398]
MLTREDLEAFIEDGEADFLKSRPVETAAEPVTRRRSSFVAQMAQAQMAMMESWQRSMLPRRF